MAMDEVYSATTAPNPKSSWFVVPTEHLDKTRFILKIFQVLLSSVAFFLEEAVSRCYNCTPLYFFEFVSCTAFLFTLLLLILLSTPLHQKATITCWPTVDFCYTGVIALLLFISSIVFASNNGHSSLETSAVVFGFLAMLAFIADFALFWKNQGHPFSNGGKAPTTPGGAVQVEAPAEKEKLTTEANGAD
ncbi:CKLF-like MARVEL transmembrane domain-containing protein 6 [Acanthochromis polyacanthus]|uniref:CKLF-like MARVEL transmembrane domain-containing protein 6 n=1 Tax=Acanthochromis polyacanthus TaxID=80966 RepID=A0A3Q1FA70_9TELE|nr:CKLF-like MARVEL transmembrane domain-containing protein 6 [Acanthochromis polyacanthus]